MKILFLDDDKNRVSRFKEVVPGHEIVFVETPEEANHALERRSRFDIVSLDHDLYGKVYQPSDEKSGFAVCQFLRKMSADALPLQVICHSYNEQGVLNMMVELEPLLDLGMNSYNAFFDSLDYWKYFPIRKGEFSEAVLAAHMASVEVDEIGCRRA